jgi:glycosyltransferase involved in cell wall biosynthesis
MAAKIDRVDAEYFRERIEPLLDKKQIEYIGEVNESQKNRLLGRAKALLFPIDWPEPFGLVMIESMACGTPVIAFRNGSVPEVMQDGVTGFIVETVDEAVAACRRLDEIRRSECRRHFIENFSARRMAEGYLEAYERAVQSAAVASPPLDEFRDGPRLLPSPSNERAAV